MDPALRGINNRAYRSVIETALKQGWTASLTGSGHVRLDPPRGGGPIFCARTSGGGRGDRNLKSILKQRGVHFGHRSTKGTAP